MQYTRNYNLKKPDYTDFADIKDINDNMDKLDEELAAPTGDTADSTATFTCSDVADGDAAAWTTVPALASGETHKSLFAKISQMFKNIRFLYKLLGTTDISSIGNGTVTGGISSLNDSLADKMDTGIYTIAQFAQFSVGCDYSGSEVNRINLQFAFATGTRYVLRFAVDTKTVTLDFYGYSGIYTRKWQGTLN